MVETRQWCVLFWFFWCWGADAVGGVKAQCKAKVMPPVFNTENANCSAIIYVHGVISEELVKNVTVSISLFAGAVYLGLRPIRPTWLSNGRNPAIGHRSDWYDYSHFNHVDGC